MAATLTEKGITSKHVLSKFGQLRSVLNLRYGFSKFGQLRSVLNLRYGFSKFGQLRSVLNLDMASISLVN